jgi:sulfane dehydrogenase subunit SoxC
MTPHHDARGIITPSSLHHEVHHAGVPTTDPAKHTLLIHGLVKRPLMLTVYDLLRFPSIDRIHFLECAGNTGRERREPTLKDVQQPHGQVSGTEWTGVPLSTLLRSEVRMRPTAAGESDTAGRGASRQLREEFVHHGPQCRQHL